MIGRVSLRRIYEPLRPLEVMAMRMKPVTKVLPVRCTRGGSRGAGAVGRRSIGSMEVPNEIRVVSQRRRGTSVVAGDEEMVSRAVRLNSLRGFI
jgi:hypothetical protein